MTMQQNSPLPRWVFEPVGLMGGARATAWQDTLEGSDLPTEARVAREAIQNSVDATVPGEKTEVFVWDKSISGQELATFRKRLALSHPESPASRLRELGLGEDNSFQGMKSTKGKIRVTIIEDRNTCGLGFDESEQKDRFEELCLFLGQESTAVNSERGGSYGFGKTVYQTSSDCRTFLVYSVFEPSEETGHHHARLFGCSNFSGHSLNDENYTGRAWFGVPGRDKAHCSPVVDAAAHELAQSLGFMKREPNELGTSIMILGSEIDMDELRRAVEDYWWPRLESDKLLVELWEGNDKTLPPPEPLERDDLNPYIRSDTLIEDDSIPIREGESRRRMNARDGTRPGTLALVALPPDASDEREDPEDDTRFKNTVALIRSGPRMVVEYFDTGGRQRGNFAGTFVSHTDSEKALHLSEPAAHDAWNPNSDRLRREYPGGANLVRGIINTIRKRARDFQRAVAPPPPPVQVSGTRKLQQLLARVMPAHGLGTGGPQPVRDPFHIRIDEGRTNSSTGSEVTATVEVWLREDAPFDTTEAKVSISPMIVLDDNRQRASSERLALSSVAVDGVSVDSDVEGDSPVSLQLSKDTPVIVEAVSKRFDRDLYADLEVSVSLPRQ